MSRRYSGSLSSLSDCLTRPTFEYAARTGSTARRSHRGGQSVSSVGRSTRSSGGHGRAAAQHARVRCRWRVTTARTCTVRFESLLGRQRQRWRRLRRRPRSCCDGDGRRPKAHRRRHFTNATATRTRRTYLTNVRLVRRSTTRARSEWNGRRRTNCTLATRL